MRRRPPDWRMLGSAVFFGAIGFAAVGLVAFGLYSFVGWLRATSPERQVQRFFDENAASAQVRVVDCDEVTNAHTLYNKLVVCELDVDRPLRIERNRIPAGRSFACFSLFPDVPFVDDERDPLLETVASADGYCTAPHRA